MSNSEKWVSVEVVAEHVGVSIETIRRWIAKRGLPAHRAGRAWRLKVSEVDEWVRSGGAGEQPEDAGGDLA